MELKDKELLTRIVPKIRNYPSGVDESSWGYWEKGGDGDIVVDIPLDMTGEKGSFFP
jgi:hypothetical protein